MKKTERRYVNADSIVNAISSYHASVLQSNRSSTKQMHANAATDALESLYVRTVTDSENSAASFKQIFKRTTCYGSLYSIRHADGARS